jgi:hypothetical protein
MQDGTVARRELHMRHIEMRVFARADGLWDIEAHLLDQKPFAYVDPGRGRQESGDAVHDIHVRLTLDDERVIRDVNVEMGSMPFGSCHEIKQSLRPLIGERVGRGWRQILKKIPRNATCAHVHEVLIPMATVVHQGMSMGRKPDEKVAMVPDPSLTVQPFFVDDCHSWRADGPVVAQFYPQFSRKRS